MESFLTTVPGLIRWGCLFLLGGTVLALAGLLVQSARVRSRIGRLMACLDSGGGIANERYDGLSLPKLERLRTSCDQLAGEPLGWWNQLERNIEQYTSPEGRDGWFLTERPQELLSYDAVVGRYFHSAMFNSVPGILTAFGLILTFTAILLALKDVHYNQADTVDPISGIKGLIDGLSGKFLSSIVALILSILFTFFEKYVVRALRLRYSRLIAAVTDAIPYLSGSRILLDIQRFAQQQTVSVSNISSSVVDRFVGAFNDRVVPNLTAGMSAGVAEGFRPTVDRMADTIENLQNVIIGLEGQKHDSVTGEIRNVLDSLEKSLSQTLSRMGEEFQAGLSGGIKNEFGSAQATMESSRHMLSEMNAAFGSMQAAFVGIIEKAEQSTSDQMKTGREQAEALTAVMNGLMMKLQETADQNLSSVREKLTLVVSDLSERVGTVSRDMMAAAERATQQSQSSAREVLEQTGAWSEATARRLDSLLEQVEARSIDFQRASQSLLEARSFLADLIGQNATALGRMAEAGRQVQAYSAELAGHSEALRTLSNHQTAIAGQLREVSANVRASFEQHGALLAEYRTVFQDYKSVIDELDVNLGKILGTLHGGLRDYNQTIENNFKGVVAISNEMVPQISNLLRTHVEDLSEGLEELGTVITHAVERANGRVK